MLGEEFIEGLDEILIGDPFFSVASGVVASHHDGMSWICGCKVDLVKLFILACGGHGHIILIYCLIEVDFFIFYVF